VTLVPEGMLKVLSQSLGNPNAVIKELLFSAMGMAVPQTPTGAFRPPGVRRTGGYSHEHSVDITCKNLPVG
jgi:hypothetical protein